MQAERQNIGQDQDKENDTQVSGMLQSGIIQTILQYLEDVISFQHYYSKLEKPIFFVESEVYWKPGPDCRSIYDQLAKKRYREIARKKIQ